MALDLKAFTAAADGFGPGAYSSVFESMRSAVITLQRDIFSGDNLRIDSKRSSLDSELQKIRPVRFYTDSTKIFDGLIKDPSYNFKGNSKNNFSAVAVSWDKELAGILISTSDNAVYSAQTINYIFTDLVRIANNYGITKKATYAYDTSKLPYYDAGVFGTTITRDFTGMTVWSAMQELTQALDYIETVHFGEWAIKIDALQSDSYIYIIPQMLNTDIAATKTYKNFQLSAGKSISKDYSRLLNYCEVAGNGYSSQMIRTVTGSEATTQLLTEKTIPDSQENYLATNAPASRRYQRVRVENPGSEKTGTIIIAGWADETTFIHERTYLIVPAGSTRYYFTKNRYYLMNTDVNYEHDGDYYTYAYDFRNFTGCKVTVDECMLSIAGKSINDFGTRNKYISKNNLSSQASVDAYSVQQVRMYHAPQVNASISLLPAWIDYTELIGKTVRIYDELAAIDTDFFCTRQQYNFAGAGVHETIGLQRYNYDWEYAD